MAVKSIGRFDVSKRVLGSGAFARVYEAVDTTTQAPVAARVSMRKRETLDDDVFRSLRKIHDHHEQTFICRILDKFGDDERTIIFLEFCGGGDLEQALRRRGSIEEPVAQRLFRQLIVALQCMDTVGLHHRDLKPANVMLTSTDLHAAEVRVTDFGLARRGDLLQSDHGTKAYWAPERFNPRVEYSRSADLYAAGVILFEMLMGRHPFLNVQQPSEFQMIRDMDRGAPPVDRRKVSRGAAQVIKRCLEPLPGRRCTLAELVAMPWVAEAPLGPIPRPPVASPSAPPAASPEAEQKTEADEAADREALDGAENARPSDEDPDASSPDPSANPGLSGPVSEAPESLQGSRKAPDGAAVRAAGSVTDLSSPSSLGPAHSNSGDTAPPGPSRQGTSPTHVDPYSDASPLPARPTEPAPTDAHADAHATAEAGPSPQRLPSTQPPTDTPQFTSASLSPAGPTAATAAVTPVGPEAAAPRGMRAGSTLVEDMRAVLQHCGRAVALEKEALTTSPRQSPAPAPNSAALTSAAACSVAASIADVVGRALGDRSEAATPRATPAAASPRPNPSPTDVAAALMAEAFAVTTLHQVHASCRALLEAGQQVVTARVLSQPPSSTNGSFRFAHDHSGSFSFAPLSPPPAAAVADSGARVLVARAQRLIDSAATEMFLGFERCEYGDARATLATALSLLRVAAVLPGATCNAAVRRTVAHIEALLCPSLRPSPLHQPAVPAGPAV